MAMNDPMPFDREPRCVKCSPMVYDRRDWRSVFQLRFVSAGVTGFRFAGEHVDIPLTGILVVTCNVCGYAWLMHTADRRPEPDEPEVDEEAEAERARRAFEQAAGWGAGAPR